MRLVRLGPRGEERAAVLVSDDEFVDVADQVGDFDEHFFGLGMLATLESIVDERRHLAQPLAGLRIGAPVARPHQILCIGLNYADHARETGQQVPSEPIVFTKSPNTLQGPNDYVKVPRASFKTDWEVELAVVIGRRSSYLADEAEAERAIAGYMISNDLSERTWQLERQGQWSKGKSAPTFNPAGPWLATADSIDVNDMEIWLNVDGVRRQSSRTSQMVFKPARLVHYLSQFMALEPGDVINTGTPPGVGMGLRPPRYLKGGETLTLGVEGLGVQHQRVLPAFE
jgi:2-keto-4-pentenoate hydratase/2-oxohepta-3-ene-1,7-dioic acid hydratase in catechol pathway